MNPDTLIVDTEVEYHAFSKVHGPMGAIEAAREAFNRAVTNTYNAQRTPVQIEVRIRVAPL